jgi:RNA recognition motif-containing protein
MIDKFTQKSLGYGFVEFTHPNEAEAAIRILDGKKYVSCLCEQSLCNSVRDVVSMVNRKNFVLALGKIRIL